MPPAAVHNQSLSSQDELAPTLLATLVPKKRLDGISEATQIAESIFAIYERLASLRDLKPRPEVDTLFSQLVSTCTKQYSSQLASQILANKCMQRITPRLRSLCSEGEGELERFWARKILHSCQERNGEILAGDRG
jgi:hypothetical protein